MKHKILSLMLAAVMALGLVVPALAYETPDFTDVPAGNWAYDSVMRMADRGIVKGTGNKMFSPNGIATAEQFLTLVGRVVFPEIKAEGSDWSGPYVAEAKSKGLLDGTNVNDGNLKGEISRYDMAVILAKAVDLLKVSVTKADSSKVTDYGEIPTKYVDAVLTAYGSGLITGDENHNFNGQKSMRRNELATVMDRLLKLSGETSQGGTPTKPEPTDPPEAPVEKKMVTYTFRGYLRKTDHVIGRPVDDKHIYLPDVPFKVYYTEDGGETSTLVYEGVTGSQEWNYNVAYEDQEGKFVCSVELPEDAFSSPEKGLWFSAETELDGQRLVTGDLRTDGRAFKEIQHFRNSYWQMQVELTPPEGEKAHFTFQGHVLTQFATEKWGGSMPGFTVQLHLPDGRIVGEAVSKEDGSFSMECVVDALDGGFDSTEKKNYYVTVSGSYKGSQYAFSGISNTGELMLTSLWQLRIYDEYGREQPNQDHIIGVSEKLLQKP